MLSAFTENRRTTQGSIATAGQFNRPLSDLSRNLDQLNSDASAEIDSLQSGKADSDHTHAAGDVDTGQFADGRVSASAVTQHESALSLSASQVTNGTFADARIAESSVVQHEGAIDHDALTNFSAAEHLDWTADQSGSTIADGNLSADIPRANEDETISSAWTHGAAVFFSDSADAANGRQAARPIIHHGSGSASAVGVDGALHTEDA